MKCVGLVENDMESTATDTITESPTKDRGEVVCHCGGGIEASTIENEGDW
jgi:hypothetical protein